MQRLKTVVLGILLILGGIHPSWGFPNPQVKSIGLNALYGTVGGALLGISSLAFGAGGRTIAKGASLGLYLGLAFGIYVVASYTYGLGQSDKFDYPNNEDNIYEQEGGGNKTLFDFGREERYYQEFGGNYPRLILHRGVQSLKRKKFSPVFKLNLFEYRF